MPVMKILFVNLPTFTKEGKFNRPIRFPTYNYATPVMHPPLLLAYAAAYTRQQGYKVDLVDAPVLSLTVEGFFEKVKSFMPDFVVAETSTPSFNSDVKVLQKIKQKINCKVVFLGTHVSALPEESLKSNTVIDAVVMGEYELSLVEFLKNGPVGTKGIAYRDDGGNIVINERREYIENLDILPFPARDLVPNYKYFDPILKNPFTFILSGRGCPYRCTYCNWPQTISGRKYRLRSSKNIVDELEYLQKNFNFRSVLFNDDTFTANSFHVNSVCEEILNRGLKIRWAAYSRADFTNKKLLRKMREAGCTLLKIGVESGNQEILDRVKKNYKIEKIIEGVKNMLEAGFHIHATFVIGFPGETWSSIKSTLYFAKKLNPTTVQFSSVVPYPGTELFEYLEKNGYLLTQNWDEYMPLKPLIKYPKLSPADIKQAIKYCYRNYYFRPKYIKVGLKSLMTQPHVFLGNLKKFITLVFFK